MIHVLWEFRVKPGMEGPFERHYSSSGHWAQLFGRGAGYQGTALWRDTADAHRYLLSDAWSDLSSYHRFKEDHAAEYARLDERCTALTLEERCLGFFEER